MKVRVNVGLCELTFLMGGMRLHQGRQTADQTQVEVDISNRVILATVSNETLGHFPTVFGKKKQNNTTTTTGILSQNLIFSKL